MEKFLSRGLFVLYLLFLVWLVIFKFRFDITSIFDHEHRSLNLIPFAAPSIVNGQINLGEMIMNCVFFIPLGLLLHVNFKHIRFLPKLFFVLIFSLAAELIQYIFAIGATDITDLITNTLGGFLGLTLYQLCNKFIKTHRLDSIINTLGAILLILFISIHLSHFVRR